MIYEELEFFEIEEAFPEVPQYGGGTISLGGYSEEEINLGIKKVNSMSEDNFRQIAEYFDECIMKQLKSGVRSGGYNEDIEILRDNFFNDNPDEIGKWDLCKNGKISKKAFKKYVIDHFVEYSGYFAEIEQSGGGWESYLIPDCCFLTGKHFKIPSSIIYVLHANGALLEAL